MDAAADERHRSRRRSAGGRRHRRHRRRDDDDGDDDDGDGRMSSRGSSETSSFAFDAAADGIRVRVNARDAVDADATLRTRAYSGRGNASSAPSVDENETEWETMTRCARAYSGRDASNANPAARRRRFCALANAFADTKRGTYALLRCPGAVSALKRMMNDDDAETREAACLAAANLAKTETGAAVLCSSDASLASAQRVITEWEWKLALARVRATFDYKIYVACVVARLRAKRFSSARACAAVDAYLSSQVFYPLQTSSAARNVSFKDHANVDVVQALAKVLARRGEKPEVLSAALRVVDELVATVDSAVEIIPLVDDATRVTAQKLARSSPASLAALDPVDAFMGDDWTTGVKSKGCFIRLFDVIARFVARRFPGSKSTDDDGSDDGSDDADSDVDAREREDWSYKRSFARFSVLDHDLARHLMLLTERSTDATIRDDARRILYDASLSWKDKRLGKSVFKMVTSADDRVRACALAWCAYLFVQHGRTVKTFVSMDADAEPPLTPTTKRLLSEDGLRTAGRGLLESNADVRASAARCVRAAWDAVAAKPELRAEPKAKDDDGSSSAEDFVSVDARLTFRVRERWLVFVDTGVVAALCDLRDGRAGAESRALADVMLEHMSKTEPAAMRYLVSRMGGKDALEREGRAKTRARAEAIKLEMPKRRVKENDDDDDDDDDKEQRVNREGDDTADGDDDDPPTVSRWREYRKSRKPLATKFTEADARFDRDGDADDGRPTWRERTEGFILAGGGETRKNGEHVRRGPHERAVLREGGGFGLAARRERLPAVFDKPSVGGGGKIGPHARDEDFVPSHASARVFTKPSKRHEVRKR